MAKSATPFSEGRVAPKSTLAIEIVSAAASVAHRPADLMRRRLARQHHPDRNPKWSRSAERSIVRPGGPTMSNEATRGIDLASVDRVLRTTRSVRRRLDLDRPVPAELIEEAIDVALQAPTGANSQ